jgi:hypothetical protein
MDKGLKNIETSWVVGEHGAYLKFEPSVVSPNWPHLVNPSDNLERFRSLVEDEDQIPADCGLFTELPTYPYFEGWAFVLEEGAVAWNIEEGMQYIVAGQKIPLTTADFW